MTGTERLDRAVSIASNLAYLLLVLSVVAVMFPGARRRIQLTAAAAFYSWRYGVWLSMRPAPAPVPAWVGRAFEEGGSALPPE